MRKDRALRIKEELEVINNAINPYGMIVTMFANNEGRVRYALIDEEGTIKESYDLCRIKKFLQKHGTFSWI